MVKTWVQQPSLYYNFKRNNLTKKAQKHSSNQKHIHCPTRKTSENYTPHRKKFCRSMSIQNNFIISHGECKSLFSCMKWSLVISCKLDPLRKWLFLTSRLLHFSMLTLFSFKIKNEPHAEHISTEGHKLKLLTCKPIMFLRCCYLILIKLDKTMQTTSEILCLYIGVGSHFTCLSNSNLIRNLFKTFIKKKVWSIEY